MENELTHYGVKGMKWGVRRDLTRYKKFSDWRAKVDERKSEKWTEKADKSAWQSPLNPIYNYKVGRAHAYSKKAEERRELSEMCDKLIQAHDDLITKIPPETIMAGKKFIEGKLSAELERRARLIM